MSKFQIRCSCITCKISISTQNLASHYKSKHIAKTPKVKCQQCGALTFSNKFCDKRCAALFNNNIRSAESRRRQRKSIIATLSAKPKTWRLKNKRIRACVICSIISFRNGVTCSDTCYRLRHSRLMKLHDRQRNRGRHKRSYLEKSFYLWLISNDFYAFHTERMFKSHLENKRYFCDFVFESIKLIVELDGSQHEATVHSDMMRDTYLTSIGYTVVRINHKTYQSGSMIAELQHLLAPIKEIGQDTFVPDQRYLEQETRIELVA